MSTNIFKCKEQPAGSMGKNRPAELQQNYDLVSQSSAESRDARLPGERKSDMDVRNLVRKGRRGGY